MQKLEIGGLYQHYKGTKMRVLAEAVHTETGEKMAIYMHLEDGAIWARPTKMFLEDVVVGGKKMPRFKQIKLKVLVPSNKPKK